MRRISCLAAASLMIWACSGDARAQSRAASTSHSTHSVESGPDAIRLDVLDCARVSGAGVRELIALEVAPRRVLAGGSDEPAATHATLSCTSGVAHVSVADAKRSTRLHLEIALQALEAPARTRLVALAIAELITTSKLQPAEPSTQRDPAGSTGLSAGSLTDRDTGAEASDRDSAASARPSANKGGAAASARQDAVSGRDAGVADYDAAARGGGELSGMQVWLGLGAARIAEPSMLAPAAAGGVSMHWRALGLNADLRFEHAQATLSAAELALDAASLALVPAWRLPLRVAEISLGPGIRAGYASMRATPRDAGFSGQSVNGFWLAPCAQLVLQLRFAQRWAVRIGAELAYITRTVRGIDPNGATILELRDLALAGQLGISWDAVAAR